MSLTIVPIDSAAGLKLAQFVLFACFLILQWRTVGPVAVSADLPPPIEARHVRALTLGEPAVAARLIADWLLTYDTHEGRVTQYRDMDYSRLTGWLTTLQELDPLSDESVLLATGVFIEVPDVQRQRQMIEFVRQSFLRSPQTNWRWMGYATLQAKYRLHDLALALSMAHDLRTRAGQAGIPAWARDLEILVLQDMGEFEAAITLTQQLLTHDAIHDADEMHFLNNKLKQLQQHR